MKFKSIIGGAILAIATASSAQAATNLVTNGSFEANGDVFVNAGNIGNTDIIGWTTVDGPALQAPLVYLVNPAAYGIFANYIVSPDGGNVLFIDGAATFKAATAQSISGLTIGNKYNLKFEWAAAQQSGFPGPTFDKYLTVSFGNESFSTTPQAGPEGSFQGWFTEHYSFTATSATQVLSFLASGSPDGVPPLTILDGVSLTAAVPEPSSWAMLIAGFGIVGAAARRRRLTSVAA